MPRLGRVCVQRGAVGVGSTPGTLWVCAAVSAQSELPAGSQAGWWAREAAVPCSVPCSVPGQPQRARATSWVLPGPWVFLPHGAPETAWFNQHPQEGVMSEKQQSGSFLFAGPASARVI